MASRPLRGVVFDFDGVLIDSEPLHHAAVARVAGELGADLSWERYAERYMGLDDRGLFRRLAEDLCLAWDDEEVRALADRKCRYLVDGLGGELPPLAGARAWIEAAAAGGLRRAVCTGSRRAEADALLARLDGGSVRRHVEELVTADDVEAGKPDPAGYRLAACRLALEPAECVAVEDTAVGLEAARAAGLATVLVRDAEPPGARAPGPRADVRLRSLEDRPLADVLEELAARRP